MSRTAAQILFDRGLRGHLHFRRVREGGETFLLFWKGAANRIDIQYKFRLDGDTLTLVEPERPLPGNRPQSPTA